MNLNKVTIAGRLGKDPELKQTPSGKKVASFSIATNQTWKDAQGQKQESTEWINCVSWGRTAEVIAQYFTKGKEIYIEGRMQTRSWDGNDGKKNYRTEVVVSQFQFVGFDGEKKPAQSSTEQPYSKDDGSQPPPPEEAPEEEINIEDIPF